MSLFRKRKRRTDKVAMLNPESADLVVVKVEE